MRRRFLVLALALLPAVASAADWARLSRIKGEDQYFYDRSKLVIEGDEVTYWKKVVFKQPQPVKNQLAAWGLMRERINCAQHTLRLISYLYYAADGAIIEYVPDHDKEGTPIIPDTLGDAFERHMCALVKAQQEAAKPAPSTPPPAPDSTPPAPFPAPAAAPAAPDTTSGPTPARPKSESPPPSVPIPPSSERAVVPSR